MSKTAERAERKALELRQARAEAEKAELDLEKEQFYFKNSKADRKRKLKLDPTHFGIFNFCDTVSEGSCLVFAERLEAWARIHPGKPLTIYLSTPGGSVLSGFGLYDTIRSLSSRGHHVTTVVRGYAASFGAVLLQAGDVRIVGPESRIMLHEVSSMAWGKLHEVKDQVSFTKELNTRIFDLIAERAGVDGQTGDSLYKWAKAKDRWISAKDSVARGFADEVG